MILRILNVQGIAGIAVSFALAILLVIQKGETRHWKKQSASFERLYQQGQTAFAGTVASYRAAAEEARAADQANASRVDAEQRAITERTANEYKTRIAAARATAERLRLPAKATADSGGCGDASMPRLPATAGGPARGADENGLSRSDALIATEQAIQLDELIQWVRQQHAVRVDGVSGERPLAAGAQAKVDNNRRQ